MPGGQVDGDAGLQDAEARLLEPQRLDLERRALADVREGGAPPERNGLLEEFGGPRVVTAAGRRQTGRGQALVLQRVHVPGTDVEDVAAVRGREDLLDPALGPALDAAWR